LIGKDRDGSLRQRLSRLSREPLLFVDMYPDEEAIHIEEYQLRQLESSGVKRVRKQIDKHRRSDRVVIYPEKEYRKRKWPVHNFVDLYNRSRSGGAETLLLEPIDLDLPVKEKVRFEELSSLVLFLQEGGVFVSNDSGVAHLAAACGMATVTLFCDEDPCVWHPGGTSFSIRWNQLMPDCNLMGKIEEALSEILSAKTT
jgi:ADP-heptose:LPS heptosyltransferase